MSLLSDSQSQTSSLLSELGAPTFRPNDEADAQLARDAIKFAGPRSRATAPLTPTERDSLTSNNAPSKEDVIKRLREEAILALTASENLLDSEGEGADKISIPKIEDSDLESDKGTHPALDEDYEEDEERDLDQETQEAVDVLARLMDEVEFEQRDSPHGQDSDPRPVDEAPTSSSPPPPTILPNKLPSPPSNLPEPTTYTYPNADPDTIFATSIAARMAALRTPSPLPSSHPPDLPSAPATDVLGLPSVPTTLPSSSPRPPPPPEPSYSCVICYDDATILCQGCEENFGDAEDALYCARCWKEGHLGPDAREERGHEWVKFKRPM